MTMSEVRWPAVVLAILIVTGIDVHDAYAQLGSLVSPGRLSRPHASLEGIGKCLQCHTAGRQVAADKCLTCHQPVAERIAQKRGVHRAVTTDCVSCHVEHAGVDAELRPFNQRTFDHAAQTGFPIDGLHATPGVTCESCHKTRSFLSASATCSSCHNDVHRGSLGTSCANCHSTSVRFAAATTQFNHSRTAFPLAGAHATVTCMSCHQNGRYKGVAFATCTSCHTDPHRQQLGARCESCHTPQSWRTTRVDHSRTAFPLLGRHADVRCVACHTRPATQVRPEADTCAACHTDPHRGEFRQDCSGCHTVAGFTRGTFDHNTTRFPLMERHAGLQCVACHTSAAPQPVAANRSVAARTIDFRGLSSECVSCHADVHRAELGTACEKCHTARTFDVTSFTHARPRSFFDGQHATLRCVQCHLASAPGPLPAPQAAPRPAPVARTGLAPARTFRVGFTSTSDSCTSCHLDVHLGQVDTSCSSCHTVETPRFAVARFDHGKTRFALTGKHAPLECQACHKVERAAFPAGEGTARRLTAIPTACAACHQDPHAGQFTQPCQQCHSTERFTLPQYTHVNARSLRSFFSGRHVTTCAACHKPSTAAASTRTAVSYQVTTTCTNCHNDIHRGALGPRCESCHRP